MDATELWEYYASIPAPTYDPFKETRELMTHQTGFRVGGRGHGKTARLQAQLEGTRHAMTWLDEYTDWLVAMYHDPYQGVRDLIYRTPWTEPFTAPEVASVRWACKPPTAPVYAEGTSGWAMEDMLARISPEEREHNRKLNAENAALMAGFAEMLGVNKP